jgi:hypothetical protein
MPDWDKPVSLEDAVLNTTGARLNLACLNVIPALQVGSFQGDLREFLSSGNDEDDNPVDEMEEGDEERSWLADLRVLCIFANGQ